MPHIHSHPDMLPFIAPVSERAIIEVVGRSSLETRRSRNSHAFRKVEASLDANLDESEDARAELGAVLDQTSAVVTKLAELNERDGRVLTKLYESSIFEKPIEQKQPRAALHETKARYMEPKSKSRS